MYIHIFAMEIANRTIAGKTQVCKEERLIYSISIYLMYKYIYS